MAETISVRIDEEQLAGIDFIAEISHKKKSDTLREVLTAGIKKKKLDIALQKFAQKEATAWKAARLADIPLTSFFDVLKERGILFHYSKEEVEQEFQGLR